MSTVSRIVPTVRTADGTRLSPTAGVIALDESWAPYCTAQGLTIPLTSSLDLDALDPRQDARVTVRLSQQFGEPFALAALTGDGLTSTAAMTADLAGAPLSVWTGRYGRPYNPAGPRPSRVRRFDLGIRSRVVDHAAGTVTLSLASDEALAQDTVNLDSLDRQPPTNSVHGVVALALSAIGAVCVFEADDVPLDDAAVSWPPGQSAWDYVRPLVDAAGLRLWCDEGRTWHLTEPNIPRGAALHYTAATVKRLQDTLSRDEAWYDAVHLTYRWRDSSDIERVRYDVAASPGASRARSITYDRPYPGPHGASSMLARMTGRGRVQTFAAVADPLAAPSRPVSITMPDTPIQAGFLAQVQWDLGADEMQIRTRDLTDASPNAWIFAQGTWADVAGISWADSHTENEGA